MNSCSQILTPTRLFALFLLLFSLFFSAACGEAAAEKKKSKKSKADDAEVTKTEDEHKGSNDDKTKTHDPHKPEREKVSLQPIWNDLMNGNKQFMSGKYAPGDLLAERRELAKGQKPKVIVLGCADSRVPPELIFGKNTGDLFIIRNAGNLADPIVLGSMEYAVEHLESQVIVVLGHESCGAVAATVAGGEMPSRNLQAIVDAISPALATSEDCPIGGKMNLGCVELNVQQTAKQLTSRSKILKESVDKGHLAIVKAVYKMETGEVVRVE